MRMALVQQPARAGGAKGLGWGGGAGWVGLVSRRGHVLEPAVLSYLGYDFALVLIIIALNPKAPAHPLAPNPTWPNMYLPLILLLQGLRPLSRPDLKNISVSSIHSEALILG